MVKTRLDQIARELDTFFRIDEFQPDSPFTRLVPRIYESTGIQLERYVQKSFLETFHGLMIRNGQTVDKIYCTVFLSEEILDKVFAQDERDVLLISHHPLAMETSNRGFLPLSERYFEEMQGRAISVYVLHTPLDVHDEISTSRALARELGLEDPKGYYQVPGGYAGLYGRLPAPMEFDALLSRIGEVTGVGDLHFIRNHHVVHTLAIIPGGTDVVGIREASALPCDAFLTGTYYNLVQNEVGRRYREEFDGMRDSLEISLIEGSHYASEAVVMREEMVDLCVNRFGIDCEFIPQDDPWY